MALSCNITGKIYIKNIIGCGGIIPNNGAVDFDGASYYDKTLTSSLSDGSTITVGVWLVPDLDDISVITEAAFNYTSGKISSIKTPWRLRQQSTEKLRLFCTGAKTSLQVTMPPIMDVGEYNLMCVSGDVLTGVFTYLHWSETSGLAFGTVVPDANNNELIEFSSIEDIRIGAEKGAVGGTSFFNGTVAQVYVSQDLHDFTNSSTQAKVITSDKYKSMQNLGTGLVAHSGNTSSFKTNNGSFYDELGDTNTVALTDAAGPSPPFTL